MIAQTISIVVLLILLAVVVFVIIRQSAAMRKLIAAKDKNCGSPYAMFQDLFKNSALVFYTTTVDKPYNIVFTTENCKNLLGYMAEAFMSGEVTVNNLIHPEDIDMVITKHREMIRDDKTMGLHFRCKTADGEYIWLDEYIFLHKGVPGGQPLVMGFITNAIEDIHKQRELQKSREYFYSLFENAGVAILIVNRYGAVIDANEAACTLLNTSLFSQHIQNYLDSAGLKLFEDAVKACNEVGDNKNTFDCTLIPNNRENRYIHCVLNLFDQDKSLCMLQLIDITEQNAMFEQMKTLVAEETERRVEGERLLVQKAKMAEIGEMMDAIVHQWKQPLSTLFITAEMMKDDVEEEELNREELEISVKQIIKQLSFMSVTMDTFRNFFKAKGGIEKFNVTSAIENVRLMMSGVFYHNRITVQIITDLKEEDLIITGNPNEMQQVALNLLLNAKDAILSRREKEDNQLLEGAVIIGITREGSRLTIIFTDNGGGVPPSMISRIFDAYVTTKGSDGTGIGLYMSRLIISKYKNGNMTVRNVENGAQFIISMDV